MKFASLPFIMEIRVSLVVHKCCHAGCCSADTFRVIVCIDAMPILIILLCNLHIDRHIIPVA
jgi:hypothetical protein